MRVKSSSLKGWRRLCDQRGVAAVEFALVLPMLLTLYLGGYETQECVSVYRKVALTTSELANVTSQYQTMSSADLANVFNASAQIMEPYTSANLSVLITEVQTNAAGAATVVWSKPFQGATALTAGAALTLPNGMASPNTYYILIQTAYTYTPTAGAGFFPSVPLSGQIYIVPRQSSSITLT